MKAATTKLRLDKLLLDRGLAPSRERAQALVLAGKVLVDGQKVEDVPITKITGEVIHDTFTMPNGDVGATTIAIGLAVALAVAAWVRLADL